MTKEELEILVREKCKELEELLETDLPEYDKRNGRYSDTENVQARMARQVCYRILTASNADGLFGCSLCQG